MKISGVLFMAELFFSLTSLFFCRIKFSHARFPCVSKTPKRQKSFIPTSFCTQRIRLCNSVLSDVCVASPPFSFPRFNDRRKYSVLEAKKGACLSQARLTSYIRKTVRVLETRLSGIKSTKPVAGYANTINHCVCVSRSLGFRRFFIVLWERTANIKNFIRENAQNSRINGIGN